jgi:hypothetical protein
MKIETVITARSLWYADMRQFNPRGRNLFPLIEPLLKDWFGFTPPQEHDKEKGVKFVGGEFSPSGRKDDSIGIEATLYNNGIVASGRTTTDDTDLFLEHVLVRLAKGGVIEYRPEMIRRRQYASEIIAVTDKELIFPAFDKVCALLSGAVDGGKQEFTVAGLLCDIDQVVPSRQIPFRFERRANTPFSENTYYSHGPLKTQDHIAVLDAIEEALSI